MPLRARRVAEAYLNTITDALSRHDTDLFQESVALPLRRLSRTHDALIETREQLSTDFETIQSNLQAFGVNFMHLALFDSRTLGPRYIEARYITHLLKDSTPMVPPYEARIVIGLRDQDWKLIEMEWDIDTVGWAADFRSSPGQQAKGLKFAENDIRASGLDPMAVYQDHLDAIAKTEIEDDFEAYCSYLHFPYSAHSQSMDNIIEGPDDVRPFFEMIKKTRNGSVGDFLERTCDSAEFIGSDMLVGYHTGRVYKDGIEVVEPVTSRMILQNTGDRWQLLSVANTIRNKTYPFDMYAPGDSLMTDMDIQKRTTEWPSLLRTRTPRA